MKSLMKVAIVKGILFLMTTSVLATTVHEGQQAFAQFVDSAGSDAGFVYVDRETNSNTHVTSTTLFYSLCGSINTCQEGNGVIPNSTFTGTLDGSTNRAETIKLLVDTTIPGFTNETCDPSDTRYCYNPQPATGGLISATFTTTPGAASLYTLNTYIVANFRVTTNFTTRDYTGPATTSGATLMGMNVSTRTASWGLETLSGTRPSVTSTPATAKARPMLEKSIPSAAARHLQRMLDHKQVSVSH